MRLLILIWGFIFLTKQGLQAFIVREETQVVHNVISLFKQHMEKIGINRPNVVMAQIVLETNYLSSKIYKENHNLFGMKESVFRNHDIGSQYGHALYPNTNASLLDYRDWQRAMGGHNIESDEEYLYFLDHLPGNRRYATDPNYTDKLKNIIKILNN